MASVRIERIEIGAFGCLSGVVIEPSDGINLIEADNESGKSTLAAFIKFILYGFSSTRSQSIAENERKLYIPWNGTRAFGSIVFSAPGGRFRVARAYDLPSKETVEMTDLQTGREVFRSLVPGEVLLGVPEEVYQKSAYFRQLFQSKNGDESLADQVRNLVFSADERISAANAEKRLREAEAELKNRQNRGVIPELEAQLARFRAESEQAIRQNSEIRRCNEAISENGARLGEIRRIVSRLQAERGNIDGYEAFCRLRRLSEVKAEEEAAKKKYDDAAGAFPDARIPDSAFINGLIKDNAEYKSLVRDRDRLEEESREAVKAFEESRRAVAVWDGQEERVKSALAREKKLFPIFALLALLFAAAGVTFAFLFDGLAVAAAGAACLFLGCAVAAAVIKIKARELPAKYGFESAEALEDALSELPQIERQADIDEKRTYSLKAEYGRLSDRCAQAGKSIAERISRYCPEGESGTCDAAGGQIDLLLERSENAKKLLSEYESRRRTRESMFEGVDIDALAKRAEGAVPPERTVSEVERELNFNTQKQKLLEEKKQELEKEKARLESGAADPALLCGKTGAAEQQLEKANRRLAAIRLALEVLEESSAYMKSTIAPKLTEYASGYFDYATAGKYPVLHLDTRMGMAVETPLIQSLDFLSSGTKDAAYLCLRLALLRLIYQQAAVPPVILDDAFARLDDKRLETMISVITEFSQAEKAQVFMFTCTPREREALERLGKNINRLEIKKAAVC